MPGHRSRLLLAFCAIVAPTAQSQKLETPKRAGMDDSFVIRVSNLPPGSRGTLRASTPDSAGNLWTASADFLADDRGRFDTRSAPVAGDYDGAHPMGLVWAMRNRTGAGSSRYTAPDLRHVPLNVALVVDGVVRDSTVIDRGFASDSVETIALDPASRIVGTVFQPKIRSGRPVLVLGGSEGGNSSQDVAAALASRGFTALSLAYFGATGLPAQLEEIPLSYFQRAIDALIGLVPAQHSVAIVATSKGSEAALLVASIDRRVKAVVAYAPSSVAWSCICDDGDRSSWTIDGEPVTYIKPGRNPAYRPAPGEATRPGVNFLYRMMTAKNAGEAAIDVTRIDAALMLIAGSDDQLWPSAEMMRQVQSKRRQSDIGTRDRYLIYTGAGHLIGKSYIPAGSTRVASGRLETGGTPMANANAQENAWPQVLGFLRSVLNR
jgi:dienelactone hydrolase